MERGREGEGKRKNNIISYYLTIILVSYMRAGTCLNNHRTLQYFKQYST